MRFTSGVAIRHPAALAETSRLADYTRWLETARGLAFNSYHELWAWSVDDLGAFWESVWQYFDVKASRPFDHVLGSRDMPGAEWFPGAQLSYVEHMFRGRDGDSTAIVHASELRPQAEL